MLLSCLRSLWVFYGVLLLTCTPQRLSALSFRLNVCLSSTRWPSWIERQFHGAYRRDVWAQIQTDTCLRKKTLMATVEFQLYPPSPPQPRLPSFSAPTTSQQRAKTRAVVCGYVSCPHFGTQVFIKCFLLLITKNRWLPSRLCRLRAKRGERDLVDFF